MRAALAAAASALALGALARPARAGDHADACIEAADHGQSARNDGRLRQARAEFAKCAAATCPLLIQRDCARWHEDVDARIPSVLLRSRTASGDDVPASVSVDGVASDERFDGRPLELDPGKHTFRFERRGAAAIEHVVLVVERERGRLVEAVWPPGASAASAASTSPGAASLASSSSPASSSDDATSRSGPPPATIVLGAVGVVALGSFTFFGVRARNGFSDLEHGCSPACTDDEVAPVRRDAWIANVSIGVGVVALAAAGILWWTAAHARPARTHALQSAK